MPEHYLHYWEVDDGNIVIREYPEHIGYKVLVEWEFDRYHVTVMPASAYGSSEKYTYTEAADVFMFIFKRMRSLDWRFHHSEAFYDLYDAIATLPRPRCSACNQPLPR